MVGISSRAAGKLDNKFKYNGGSELQHQEFSDGSGLDIYATAFRSYDPQIGRFHQIDPLSDLGHDISPFAFANNNPILLNDPLGLIADSVDSKGNVWHGLDNVVVKSTPRKKNESELNQNQVDFTWNKKNKNTTISQIPIPLPIPLPLPVILQPNKIDAEAGLLGVNWLQIGKEANANLQKLWFQVIMEVMGLLKAEDKLRGGGQKERDGSIKKYPVDFQRWYHREYKPKVNPGKDATPDDLKEIFKDWLNDGKPEVK